MKVNDESTIVLNEGKKVQNNSPKKEESNNGLVWRSVLVGGIPGLLLGSVGTVFATPAHNQEDLEEIAALKEEVAELKENVENLQEQVNTADHHSNIPPVGDTVAVAHGVSDDMSFSEAFAAARAEVGPGGVFTWHGNVYGTYYASEWNSMSDAEKHEYAQAVHNTDYDSDSSVGHSNYHEVSNDEGEIHVLGSESVETEDGEIINVARVEVDGHYGEIYDMDNDGQPDIAAFDTNDDGQPDLVMADENGDGVISPDKVYQVDDDGMMLAMNDQNPEDALYDGMPDYTNDADVSSLV